MELQPIHQLEQLRQTLPNRLKALSAEKEALESAIYEREKELKDAESLWETLFGSQQDETRKSYGERWAAVNDELRSLEHRMRTLPREIKRAKSVREAFLTAQIQQNTAVAQTQAKAEEREGFQQDAISQLDSARDFHPKRFWIDPCDYRRGNAVDNCFQRWKARIFAAFSNRCVFCGTDSNLTMDHYGLSKNQGGNFVLITADRTSIRLNIVVLCRSCNALKAQRNHLLFFSETQREEILACQRILLESLWDEREFLNLIKKKGWIGRVGRPRSQNGPE